jgi:uncharacterized protein (TIGR00369 family)
MIDSLKQNNIHPAPRARAGGNRQSAIRGIIAPGHGQGKFRVLVSPWGADSAKLLRPAALSRASFSIARNPPGQSMTASQPDPAEQEKRRQGIIAFFNNFPFNKLMGMSLLEIEPGAARLSMSWREDLCQPAGIMHGGAIASLVDTAIAHSILLTLPAVDEPTTGGRIVSVDLRLKYLRPVSGGRIFCQARIVRPGRTIIHTDAVVTNEEGKDVAVGDSIYMIISKEQLQKRTK